MIVKFIAMGTTLFGSLLLLAAAYRALEVTPDDITGFILFALVIALVTTILIDKMDEVL